MLPTAAAPWAPPAGLLLPAGGIEAGAQTHAGISRLACWDGSTEPTESIKGAAQSLEIKPRNARELWFRAQQQQQTTTLLSRLSRDYKQAKPAAAMHASADRAPSMAGAAGAEGRDAPLHAWHVHSVVSQERTYLRGGYISSESTWKTQPCCWAGTRRLWRDRPVLFRRRSSVDTCPPPSQGRHSSAHRYGSRTDTM